jgi:hypothetical protein
MHAAGAPAYVSIRQHTPAYVSIREHTSAYVSIRQHTSAYASIDAAESFRSSASRRSTSNPVPLVHKVRERVRARYALGAILAFLLIYSIERER